MLKAVLAFALAYAGVCALLWFSQEKLLFHPQPAAPLPSPPPGWTLEAVSIESAGGVRLAGVLAKPPAERPPVVIYFGGNAEEATAFAPLAERTYGPCAVLLVNYRGYGASEGRPGEAAMVADALALHDWARARADLDGTRILAHGRSLGSGVAVQLAAARELRAVVLTSAYDSLPAVAATHYPWAPVGLLLRHRFDSLAKAPGLAVPALFVIADADTLIAPAHSERLRAAWGGATQALRLPGRGHNDLEADPGLAPAIAAFARRHLLPGAP